MTIDPSNIKSIFLAASEILPADRAAFLDQATAGNAALLARVEALLKAHDNPDSFLKEAAAEFGATIDLSLPEHPLAERVGTLIGPYKLLQQIGEGGMGVVFMAEQSEPIQRTVALKIIKPGMDTRQVIARFEAERQALAMMDHPNIARVVDAGTTDTGRPYFVMDLVKGVPITEYCDQQHLPVRARLELMAAVCHAVQHAHQKGIIHRDLKPSNVLVAEYDGKPVPKIIDFGVSKATAQRLTEKTMFTEYGQLIGTFEYMSPEQARFNQLDVDTRSDIYSLGVLLYEVLAGSTPLEKERLRAATFDEVLRIICEEEPPRPSTRLSSSLSLPSIAANRSLEPKKLSGLVRGELDWIVMKCLEKDRNRRYETANGLASDINRYLQDEAVQACPPSTAYRLRKFARRNKAAMLVASSALAVLLLGVVGLAISNRLIAGQRAQAEAERERAETERQRAEENLLRATVAVRDILFEAAVGRGDWAQLPESLRKKFTEKTVSYYQSLQQESSIPSLQYETAIGLRGLALLHESLRDHTQGERFARQAVVILDRLTSDDPDVIEYRHQQAYSQHVLAGALNHAKRQAEAEAAFGRSFELYESLISQWPGKPDFYEELTNCYTALTGMLADRGAIQEKEAVSQRFLKLFAQQPLLKTDSQQLAESYRNLASRFTSSKRYDEALVAANIAVETAEKLAAQLPYSYSTEHQQLLGLCLRERSAIHRERKRYPEAESDAESAVKQLKQLTVRFPEVPEYRTSLAGCFKSFAKLKQATGELDKSLTLYREAVRLQPDDASTHNELGNALHAQQKFPEAEAAYSEAIRLNPTTGYRFNRAESLIGARRFAEAEAEFREIVRVWPRDAASHRRLGAALQEQGKLSEAEAAYREAIRLQPDNVDAYHILVTALVKQGKFDEAIAAVRESFDNKPEHESIFRGIGWAFVDSGAYGPAEKMFRQALDCSKRLPGDNRLEVARTLTCLAFVLRQNGNLAEAESMYREALATQRKLLTGDNEDVAFTLNGLALVLARKNMLAEAEAMLRQSTEMRQRLGKDNAAIVRSSNNLVDVLAQQGKLDEAVAVCRQAIKLQPNESNGYRALGAMMANQGKLDEAIAAFRDAIRLKPDFACSHSSLAVALRQKGLLDEALAEHRKAIRLVPIHADHFTDLAATLQQKDASGEEIAEVYRVAVKLLPESAAIHAALGISLHMQGKIEEADAEMHKAVELEPKSAETYNSLAWFLANTPKSQHRDPARAVELAKKAVELAPQDGNIWNTLGVALYRAGEWQNAIKTLEKGMEPRQGGDANDWFFLAMAEWKLDHKDEAHTWHDKAVEWMDKNQPKNEELIRFRDEAAELLGISEPAPAPDAAAQP